jgi:hypothetical protein
MAAKLKKIAEFTLVHLGFGNFEPDYTTEMLLLDFNGKVLAVRKGVDKYGMILGRFYNTTPEGMYLAMHIRGRFKLQQLDGAVIKHQRQRGGPNRTGGSSSWTKIWLKDGKTDEFWE